MGKYLRMNASLTPDPVYPKPKGRPTITNTQDLDASAYLAWTYTAADADTLNGYWVRVTTDADRATVVRELYVQEPDTDVIVNGLANGTKYVANVIAVNPGGNSSPSADAALNPALPVVPTPTLKTLTGGDGQAVATWTWGDGLPKGYTYDFMSYEAVNEVGSNVTEHVTQGTWPNESGLLPLTNDHDWKCALVAVAHNNDTGKQYVSDLSNSITVHTEKPIAPYKPRLTGAQIDANNAGYVVVAFAPGIQNITATRPRRWWHKLTQRQGPADITAWQLRLTSQKDSQNVMTFDITDGSARSYTTPQKVGLGGWNVVIRAKNVVGWSDWSNELTVTYTPTDTRPFSCDKPYTTFTSKLYNYAIFDPGNDPSKGWDTTWKVTLTEAGKAMTFAVLMVGGGGGGKGQTATLGKGGDGGGGEMTQALIDPGSCDSFTVFVSIGGSVSIDPKDTMVTLPSKTLTARSGKSASSGSDAAGYPRTYVDAWTDCANAFGWLTPDSEYVGGVAQSGKQGYPNGLGWGCAGAGTKNSNPGKGVEGLVVLRWAK